MYAYHIISFLECSIFVAFLKVWTTGLQWHKVNLELETRKQLSYKISEVSWRNIGFSRERSCLFPFGTNSLWQTRPTFIKVPGTNLCSARVFVFPIAFYVYSYFLNKKSSFCLLWHLCPLAYQGTIWAKSKYD